MLRGEGAAVVDVHDNQLFLFPHGIFFFRFCFPSTRPYNYTFFFLLYVCMLSTDSSSLADGLPRLLPFASRVHFLHNPPPIAADVFVVFSFDRSSARLHVSSPFSFFVFFLNSIQFSSFSFSRERIWRVSKSIHPDV
jgi:hypothetical protein